MYIMKNSVVLFVLMVVTNVQCRELESYNIDVDAVSVSGASSGGGMAIQLHVAYSSVFMGVGTFAGVAYYCAQGTSAQSTLCMLNAGISPTYLSTVTRNFAAFGTIDNVTNLHNSRVFILHGDVDKLINPGAAETIRDYYQKFMPSENIKLASISNLNHGFPTEDYGGACNILSISTDYINKCGYNGAFEMLEWLYQGLQRPTSATPTPGDLYEYDQEEFREGVGSMSGISMSSSGYIYVPTGCMGRETACKLHVALHGCNQAADDIGDVYIKNTFYNQVGELNNIIILWPQATKSFFWPWPVNPQGCWDWWGYNDVTTLGYYATQLGDQTQAIMKMVERVIGDSGQK